MVNTVNIVYGMENCECIAALLNTQIQRTGQAIQIDNREIWSVLNSPLVRNDFWWDTVRAMQVILAEMPRSALPYHHRAVQDAADALAEHSDQHPRCMDRRATRPTTWRLIMTIREVLARVNQGEAEHSTQSPPQRRAQYV